MISRKVAVHNLTSFSFQNVGAFCEKMLNYDCEITFKHCNIAGNIKSVLSVLGACINEGDEIEVICNGKDEKAAMKVIVDMLGHGPI